jgi:zinc protease
VRDEKVTEPQVERAYIVPSDITAGPGEAEALRLLAEILGGGATSRYYDQLVRGDGPATEARAFSQTGGVDNGRFVLYGLPKPGVNLRALEARMQEVLGDLQENGVTDEELARAKLSVIADRIYELDDQEVLATAAGEALTIGLTLEELQDWPARIGAVTAAQVQEVARKHLRPEASATGYLEQPLEGEP